MMLKMVEDVVNEYGKIDVLVNNAGMTINEKAEDVSYDDWLKVINLNLNGVF